MNIWSAGFVRRLHGKMELLLEFAPFGARRANVTIANIWGESFVRRHRRKMVRPLEHAPFGGNGGPSPLRWVVLDRNG